MGHAEEEYRLTIPRFNQIPFLVHGFGLKKWKERRFGEYPDWRDFKVLSLDQVHSDEVHFIDEWPNDNLRGDAVATTLPHLFLVIKTADCLPVLFVDEKKKVIAAVHCGWRGTQKRIVERVLEGLKNHYGCKPSSLLAALGPSISPHCYEVNEDVRMSFEEAGFSTGLFRPDPERPGKYFFNLRQANWIQMRAQGIEEKNVYHLPICPHCDRRFYSFRRDGAKAGRLVNFIGMFPICPQR